MTLPLIILGLYLALLSFSLGLSSWVGHFSPAPEEARRVTDAAERAAVPLLAAPSKQAFAGLVLATALALSSAASRGAPILWHLLGCLLIPALVAAASFYSAKKLLRSTGQLAGLVGSDDTASLTSRASMGALLCVEAALGLGLLALHTLVSREAGSEEATFVAASAAAATGLFALVFGRSLGAAAIVADAPASELHAPDSPDPASLARLLSSGFHVPAVRLLTIVAVSSLGHVILLAAADSDGGPWLYAHLLKLLGLCALTFSGFVVRTSEDEHGSHGWSRGLVVHVVLMLAGAWSLSSELALRAVPATVTFLLLGFTLSAWLNRPSPPQTTELLPRSLATLPALLTSLTLGVVLVLSLEVVPTDVSLTSTGTVRFFIAAGLATAPVVAHWILGGELFRGAADARALSFVGSSSIESPTGPSFRIMPFLALISMVVGGGSLAASSTGQALTADTLLVVVFGLLLGAAWTGALFGYLEKTTSKIRSQLRDLVRTHRTGDETEEVNFGAALGLSGIASRRDTHSWLLLAMSPTLILCVTLHLTTLSALKPFALGLGLGCLIVGTTLEWLLSAHSQQSRRTQGGLVLLVCIVQTTWIVAALSAAPPPSENSLPAEKDLPVVNDI